jgi:heat shock protein HslJ
MKKFFKVCSLIIFTGAIFLLLSCTKVKQPVLIMDTDWEVSSITSPDQIFNLVSPTPYKVNFKKDNIYTMRLDINSCGSTYTLENGDNIHIEPIACTLICCDKPYADSLLRILKDVKNYKITGESLELIAPTRIINLVKVNKK